MISDVGGGGRGSDIISCAGRDGGGGGNGGVGGRGSIDVAGVRLSGLFLKESWN